MLKQQTLTTNYYVSVTDMQKQQTLTSTAGAYPKDSEITPPAIDLRDVIDDIVRT